MTFERVRPPEGSGGRGNPDRGMMPGDDKAGEMTTSFHLSRVHTTRLLGDFLSEYHA